MLMFAKIHEERYISDMYENEYLYFGSLKNFRGHASDTSGRLDPRELNIKNAQVTTLTIIHDNKEIPLHEKSKEFNAQCNEYMKDPNINCCSLHWLEIEPGHPPTTFNIDLLRMGEKTLLIYDWEKFLNILDGSLDNMGFQFSRRKVEYYNPKIFSGKITLHNKDHQFRWQNEYRVLITPTDITWNFELTRVG